MSLLLVAGCAEADPVTRDVDQYARQLVKQTNDARAAEGLPRLTWSHCAADAARQRAEALVGEELVHEPLGEVIERCRPGGRAAENLVDSDRNAAAVVDAWMSSPGHRNNIVDPSWNGLGVGCVESADGILCAQIFVAQG
jgi:uncharacterized protein YkwD